MTGALSARACYSRAVLNQFSLPLRLAVGVGIAWVAGCLDPGAAPSDPTPDAASIADAALAPDVSTTPCAQDGLGTLRVAVSLAPALANQTADVWLAVHCNDGPTPVRLVRWDGSASQALEHFGPGSYRVLGTSLRAPGHWSTAVTLAGVSTAAVSLTLGGDGVPVATLSSATTTPRPDAGVDAGGAADAGSDGTAGAPPEWQARVALRDPAGQTLGSMQVVARAVGDGFLDVSATVQNLCAAPPCAALPLVGVEARALRGDAPYGSAIAAFERAEVPYGEVVRAAPMRLRAQLPDARNVLQFAAYAAIPAASRMGAPGRP
jgi:hypothetical protein